MSEPQSPSFPDDVTVVVVSHNGRATLPRVLECLAAQGTPLDRLTVYDIASDDGTAAWLAQDWPAVRVVRVPENGGPNPARNLGLEQAGQRFVLLVDSDAYLEPGAVLALRRAIDGRPRAAMAVPVVVHDADPQRIQYAGASLHFVCEAVNPWADRPLADRGSEIRPVGTAPGVALLVDTVAAARVGRFDSRYFMGKEDGEFCYRLRLAGYEIVEAPQAVARHGSRPRSTWLYKYQIRNRWHFMLKNYATRTLVVLAPALAVHELLQLAVLVAQGHASAWLWAARELAAWRDDLRADRQAVATLREMPDRRLLDARPLVVRADVTGGGMGRTAKRLYDAWLALYWRIASPLL